MARRPGYAGSVLDIRRKARTSVVLADLDHGDLAIMRGRAQSPLTESQKIVALWAYE